MSKYGKWNLAGMLALPLAAALAALILFGPDPAPMVTAAALNAVPMLIGGAISGLLLRGATKAGGAGRGVALWPTLIPAAIGVAWYLWRAIAPSPVAPGAEHIAGPQYLLGAVVITGIVAWILCRIARARAS